MNKYFIFLMITITGCTLTQDVFFQVEEYTPRPEKGYDRMVLFCNYLVVPGSSSDIGMVKASPTSTSLYKRLQNRTNWNPTSNNFRVAYPKYNVNLLVVNQNESPNFFTWQERLIIADAMDLLTAAIHSDVFYDEMQKVAQIKPFVQNDTSVVIPAISIIQEIRNLNMNFILSRTALPENVAAEATVGGASHTIWLRHDQEYAKANIIALAIVLGHEITHNMGYKHSSNVPHGVHEPIFQAIKQMSDEEVERYLSHTPHFENAFLNQTRQFEQQAYTIESSETIKDYGLEQNIMNMISKSQ